MTSSRTAQSENCQATVVRGHFADLSDRWADRYGSAPRSMAELDLLLRRQSVHRLLLPVVQSCERTLSVLDVGCGSGNILDGFPRDAIRVTGVDFVPKMVAAAACFHPRDRFLVADATSLPITPASIDVVTCLGTLEYVPSPELALASMVATLRPGGALIVSFPNRKSLFRKLVRVERGAERMVHWVRSALTGRERHAGEGRPMYRHQQSSLKQARRLLQSAGLEVDENDVMMNTFGPWGRLGRLAVAVRASQWMSRRFFRPSLISSWLASTMVIHARKPLDNLQDGGAE